MLTYRNAYVTLKDIILYPCSPKESELLVMGGMQAASRILGWNSRVWILDAREVCLWF